MQLKYLDNYNFICKREEILEDSIKRKKSLEYNSTIYLDKLLSKLTAEEKKQIARLLRKIYK